ARRRVSGGRTHLAEGQARRGYRPRAWGDRASESGLARFARVARTFQASAGRRGRRSAKASRYTILEVQWPAASGDGARRGRFINSTSGTSAMNSTPSSWKIPTNDTIVA